MSQIEGIFGWGAGLRRRMAGGQALPAPTPVRAVFVGALGAFAAIAAVALMARATEAPLMLGSFGASCVILFALPDTPFAQPRNVVGGHVLSSAVGLACLALFGATWWSVALAVALALALMQATRTVHPPAGSNPVIVMLAQPAWSFLLTPTLAGAAILVVVAILHHAVACRRTYPRYWL